MRQVDSKIEIDADCIPMILLIRQLKERRFNGVLNLKIVFAGGGIRRCEKVEEEKIIGG